MIDSIEHTITTTVDTEVEVINAAGDTGSVIAAAGEAVRLRFTAVDKPDTPKPSEWKRGAWRPKDFDEVVEVNTGLRRRLEGMAEMDDTLVIVAEDAIAELKELAVLGHAPFELFQGKKFTTRANEFGQHEIRVNLAKDRSIDTGFQGFGMAHNGEAARMTCQGSVGFKFCDFYDSYKGIAVTGPTANVNVDIFGCSFARMRGNKCAAVYCNRGHVIANECTISEIGVRAGEERLANALYNHGFYLHLQATGDISNTYAVDIDSHFAQFRAGGKANNCICIRTANGILVGHREDGLPNVAGVITHCIMTDTEDISTTGNKTGVGLWAQRARVVVRDTLFNNCKSRGPGAAIRPEHHATIECRNVRSVGIDRVIDVDGDDVSVVGDIAHRGASELATARTNLGYTTDGINIEWLVGSRPVKNYAAMAAPKPGEVEAWMAAARN